MNTETRFTPSPWTVIRNRDGNNCDVLMWDIFADQAAVGQKLPAQASSEANARLIAAAPDMYAALKDAREIAMSMAAKSAIPYCAEFGEIAQILDAAIPYLDSKS